MLKLAMIKTEKLYTFTVEDTNNFSEEELTKFAFELCLDRASYHGWAPGFTVERDGKPITENNKLIYTFSLYGDYLEGANPADHDNQLHSLAEADKYVASSILS
jgi:hypothetical protein